MQHYVYSAFGKILKIEDGSGNNVTDAPNVEPHFTYTGREYDSESGLYYYRARYYDSSIGRFLQQDPNPGKLINPLATVNKYIYTENNPINYTDPTGEIKFRNVVSLAVSFAIGFGVGFLAGVAFGPVGGAILGGVIGYGIGGEIAYRTNIWLGGSKEESRGLRMKGRLFGAIGGIIGGIVGGVVTGGAGTGNSDFGSNQCGYSAVAFNPAVFIIKQLIKGFLKKGLSYPMSPNQDVPPTPGCDPTQGPCHPDDPAPTPTPGNPTSAC